MNNKSILFLAAVVSLAGLTSCSGKSQDNVRPENPETEIRERWARFIEHWEAEDAVQSVSIYHEDAVLIPHDNEISRGREEIEGFYNNLFESNRSSLYRHRTDALHYSGDIAVEHATFQVDWVSNNREEWTYSARAFIHWRRGMNGEWKIMSMLFNNPPDEVPES